MGIFLGDIILFMIPCILVLTLSYFLNIESFYKHFGDIMLALFLFGLGFMQLNYLIGFMFSSTESAFKYQVLVMLVLFSQRIILHLIDITLIPWLFNTRHFHFDAIEHFSLVTSPFDCLGELIKQALDHGIGKY